MADIITKILIRQGTDVQRRTAEGTGITFSSGEPGYCIDTKRLFVGDGSTVGGNAIGIQNLGAVSKLIDDVTSDFTTEALNVFQNKGASVGDIIYDHDTRTIYTLTAVNGFPPTVADIGKYDAALLYNSENFIINSQDQLELKTGGVLPQYLALSVVDGLTLTKATPSDPISIRLNGVQNANLALMPPNTVKVNNTTTDAEPTDLYIEPASVIGRTNTSTLTSITLNQLFQQGSYAFANGIDIDTAQFPPLWRLDPDFFTITPGNIALNESTAIDGTLYVTGESTLVNDVLVNGTIRCRNDIVAFYNPSDLRYKENLSVISNAISKLEKINGYEFTYNNNAPKDFIGKQSYGVIAQEIKNTLPHIVDLRESDGEGGNYLGVDYAKIIPLLIEAIKELNLKIKKLESHGCKCK